MVAKLRYPKKIVCSNTNGGVIHTDAAGGPLISITGPKTDPLEKPKVTGLSYTPKDQTANGQRRIDMRDRLAVRNLRFFGYVGEIKEGAAGNKTAPYEFYIVGRVAVWEDGASGEGPS